MNAIRRVHDGPTTDPRLPVTERSWKKLNMFNLSVTLCDASVIGKVTGRYDGYTTAILIRERRDASATALLAVAEASRRSRSKPTNTSQT